jgi:hypothetical protein
MHKLDKNHGCSEYPSGSHQEHRVSGYNEKSRVDHRRSAFYDAVTSCTKDGWKLTSLDHSTTCPSRQIEHKILRDRVEKGMNLGAYKRMSWKVSREVSRESAVDCSF